MHTVATGSIPPTIVRPKTGSSNGAGNVADNVDVSEVRMVSKCLNPRCSATFRYMWQGRLFRIDFSEASRKNALAGGKMVISARSKANSIEHFWLCANCADTMTVELGDDGVVRPIPIGVSARKPAAAAGLPMPKLVANAS